MSCATAPNIKFVLKYFMINKYIKKYTSVISVGK